MIEKSLVLMKPDAVQRGIVGEILLRIERAGLKIVGAKLISADKEITKKHYKKDAAWHKKIGEFNIQDCEKFDLDVEEIFGTSDPVKIGEIVNKWLFDMFDTGPIFAFVFEGPNAVEKIRGLVGSTYPNSAPAGTIRGDFALDSPFTSLKRKRAVFNLIHASGTVDEATEEIKLWFDEKELLSYKRTHDELYSY
jgi:nucleoside-diphosphate kinase